MLPRTDTGWSASVATITTPSSLLTPSCWPPCPLGVTTQDAMSLSLLPGGNVFQICGGQLILAAQLVGVPQETHPQPFVCSFGIGYVIYMGWHERATFT